MRALFFFWKGGWRIFGGHVGGTPHFRHLFERFQTQIFEAPITILDRSTASVIQSDQTVEKFYPKFWSKMGGV